MSLGGPRGTCLLWCVLTLVACGPSEGEGEGETNIAPGMPQVELGFVHEAQYLPCETGSDAPVIWGLQGGTWVMPVLRTRGIASPTRTEVSLTLSEGERLGEFEFVYELSMTPDAWLETQSFRVPVQHAPPNQFESIEDVYGKSALIEVRVSDDADRSADFSVAITLVEGG